MCPLSSFIGILQCLQVTAGSSRLPLVLLSHGSEMQIASIYAALSEIPRPLAQGPLIVDLEHVLKTLDLPAGQAHNPDITNVN
jgi:hypothetical protein